MSKVLYNTLGSRACIGESSSGANALTIHHYSNIYCIVPTSITNTPNSHIMFMPKLTLAAFTACAIRSSLAQDAPTLNIVDTAVAAGNFTSLSELSSLCDI